ncbi:MAG: acetyl-CoA carboxylase biotin carboxyl carrier protein [Bacteroidota bacterium]
MKASEIRNLLDFIANSGLDEVELETDDIKLKIKKNSAQEIQQNIIHSSSMPSDATALVSHTPVAPAVPAQPTLSAPEQKEQEAPVKPVTSTKDKSQYITIKSPMIGTFYQSPNPETGPFVQVGDKVSKGQTVCIIEAMKLFNEIESEQSGTVVEILVDDSSPVEFDQPLFLLDPA